MTKPCSSHPRPKHPARQVGVRLPGACWSPGPAHLLSSACPSQLEGTLWPLVPRTVCCRRVCFSVEVTLPPLDLSSGGDGGTCWARFFSLSPGPVLCAWHEGGAVPRGRTGAHPFYRHWPVPMTLGAGMEPGFWGWNKHRTISQGCEKGMFGACGMQGSPVPTRGQEAGSASVPKEAISKQKFEEDGWWWGKKGAWREC